jgi:hypothetical protein
MSYNPETPRVNAFEALWATDKPIPYAQPLPAYFYTSLPPGVPIVEMQQMQAEEDVEPDVDLEWCFNCGYVCSCIKPEED